MQVYIVRAQAEDLACPVGPDRLPGAGCLGPGGRGALSGGQGDSCTVPVQSQPLSRWQANWTAAVRERSFAEVAGPGITGDSLF
jgi:hypothetical protein